MIKLLTFTVNRGIMVNVNSNSPNGAEKENTMKYIDTTKTPAVEVETTKRAAEIADALDDIRRERVAYGYGYRDGSATTLTAVRNSLRRMEAAQSATA